MGLADDLKKQLQDQARQLLFAATKGTTNDLVALGESVAALFQNDLASIPPEDFEAAKTAMEQKLGAALEAYSEILKAGIDLKAGKLPG